MAAPPAGALADGRAQARPERQAERRRRHRRERDRGAMQKRFRA